MQNRHDLVEGAGTVVFEGVGVAEADWLSLVFSEIGCSVFRWPAEERCGFDGRFTGEGRLWMVVFLSPAASCVNSSSASESTDPDPALCGSPNEKVDEVMTDCDSSSCAPARGFTHVASFDLCLTSNTASFQNTNIACSQERIHDRTSHFDTISNLPCQTIAINAQVSGGLDYPDSTMKEKIPLRRDVGC